MELAAFCDLAGQPGAYLLCMSLMSEHGSDWIRSTLAAALDDEYPSVWNGKVVCLAWARQHLTSLTVQYFADSGHVAPQFPAQPVSNR